MTTRRYAADTTVTPQASRAEIERLLKHYGAESFGYIEEPEFAGVYFRLQGQAYRLNVRFPALDDHDVLYTPAGTYRYGLPARRKARDQLIRQRWRALKLYINAALEATATGIITLEQALYSHLLLPSGQSMYQATRQDLAQIAEQGLAPKLLEAPGG